MNKKSIFILLFTTLFGVFLITKSQPNCVLAPTKILYKHCEEVNSSDGYTNGVCPNGFELVNGFFQGRTMGVRYEKYSVSVCEWQGMCCTPPIGEYLDSLYQSFKIYYMNGTMWDYIPNNIQNFNL